MAHCYSSRLSLGLFRNSIFTLTSEAGYTRQERENYRTWIVAHGSSYIRWLGVTTAQTLTQVTETHKQTDHMNQQGLAGRVMIKQAQSHLQFFLHDSFFFSQTSKRNCHPSVWNSQRRIAKDQLHVWDSEGMDAHRWGQTCPENTRARGEISAREGRLLKSDLKNVN